MEDRYFVRFKGRVIGPLTGEKTAELVRRGQITRLHELSPDGLQWSKAEEFRELYPKAGARREESSSKETTEQATPVAKEAVEAEKWHAHVDEQNVGPVDEESIKLWISKGRLKPDTLVWKHGMVEWLPAELVRPQWFASGGDTAPRRSTATGDVVADDAGLEHVLSIELRRRLLWVYITAITGLVLSIIGFVFGLFTLVGQIFSPVAVVPILIFNMLWLVLCGWLVACMISLIRFANASSVLKHAPIQANIRLAATRLSTFWFLSGILVSSALTLLVMWMLFVIASGAKFPRPPFE